MMPAIKQQTGVSLHTLLEGLVDPAVLSPVANIEVTGITQDSRQVMDNDMFIAVRGSETHGLNFATDAVHSGVSVVLWDDADNADADLDAITGDVVCIQVDQLQQHIGEIAARFYNFPSDGIQLVGVTGTDGKTSVSHYLAQCLDSESSPCGVLGTLGNGLVHDLKPTGLTTADAVQVQHSLASLVDEGATAAVMEVSSHGLDQGRVNAVKFDTAIFTNLSQDHLDYHQTMDAYFDAKVRLFAVDGLKSAVINLDDPFGKELARQNKDRLNVWGYSTNSDVDDLHEYADFIVHTKSITATPRGFKLSLVTPKGVGHVELALLGQFNVSNALAVLTALLVDNIEFDEALKRLQKITPVAGRMELIEASNKPTVIVDYAHTPHGLASACQAVKQHFDGELWCVFGCGGDRDREKRPRMAQSAERYADHVIVTSDNPRHEDPQKIVNEILNGFTNTKAVASIIDRRDAINKTIQQASTNDVILLAGKGHESYQIIGNTYVDFDDRLVARTLLGVSE